MDALRNSWPMWLGLFLGVTALIAGFASSSDPLEQWSEAARLTARVGFPIFLLAYLARPLHQLRSTNFSTGILQRRKWIGLGFAMSHTVHLGALIIAVELAGRGWDLITIAFGGGAYLTLYAMAFTSNHTTMKTMGRRWKWLHRFGMHYLWFIFFQSYAGRIFDPETRTLGLTMTIIALAAAAMRFLVWIQARNKRNAPAS